LLIVQQNSCDDQKSPTFFQTTFLKNQENGKKSHFTIHNSLKWSRLY